jgi:hypothetical protein
MSLVLLLMMLPIATGNDTSGPQTEQTGRADDSPQPLQTFTDTVEIPPGGFYHLALGKNGTEIEEQPIPDLNRVMEFLENGTGEITGAVDKSPQWVRDDLTQKFMEISQEEIYSPYAISLYDYDNDTDMDLMVGGAPLRYYENLGTKYEYIFAELDLGFPTELDHVVEIYPCMVDLDDDGRTDVVFGEDQGYLYYLQNEWNETTQEQYWVMDTLVPWRVVNDLTAPVLADMDADGDMDIISGSDTDGVIYMQNFGNATNPIFGPQDTIVNNAVVGDVSKPTLADMDWDRDMDMLVGNEAGDLFYFENIGTEVNPIWGPNNAAEYTGIYTDQEVQPYPKDLDGDYLIDLVVINPGTRSHFYKNYGTLTNPMYTVWSTYEVMPGLNYYPREDLFLVHEPDLLLYYSDIINNAEQRYVDEIAFSVAHLSFEDLRGIYERDMGEVLVDNALYLYKNVQYLKYASIAEKGDYDTGDYYSTMDYYYRWDAGEQKRTLPRDIYYWYVVHPKVSGERVGYVNPDNGNLQAKEDGGKFWREYLFWHNDDSYPEDPSRGVRYPQATPPLLKDKASYPTIIYDGVTYNTPQGYNNNGTDNKRPFGYKDHAIEAVSNWVAKTLPLNQQEVDDNERPQQPVRIAHHHNGNCGELQDLTVSAARTCMIPAACVGMPGEDHAWSEFWLNGWHQWDNYWSDGGSEVDNFYTYYMYWGGSRTGSGVYKEQPHTGYTDVSKHYIPEDKQSTVKIKVTDRDGFPVDGARVLLLSHWLIEFGGDQSITVPVPNIYNYTDTNGECEFTCANRDITIKVVSKLGNAAQQKTYIGVGETYNFNFQLEGAKPRQWINMFEEPYFEPEFDPDLPLMVLEYEVLGGTQYPPSAFGGDRHPHDIENTIIDCFVSNRFTFEWFQTGPSNMYWNCQRLLEDTDGGVFVFQVPTEYDYDHFIGFSNQKSIETYTKVWYRLTTYEYAYDYQHMGAHFTDPREGDTLQVGDKIEITGCYLNFEPSRNVTGVEVSVDGGGTWFDARTDELKFWGGNWTYEWDSGTYLPKQPGFYNIHIRVTDDAENVYEDDISVKVKDTLNGHLRFRTPAHRTVLTLGEDLVVTGDITENHKVQSLRLYRDSGYVSDITGSLSKMSTGKWSWSFSQSTDKLNEGRYRFLVLATDPSGYETKQVVMYEFKNEEPILALETPANGSSFDIGSPVEISGRATDDTFIESMILTITGNNISYSEEWDILSYLDEDGNFSFSWDTSLLTPALYLIEVSISDQFGKGNYSYSWVNLQLPPDNVAPSVVINKPQDDETFQPGTLVEIAGLASDDRGVSKLQLKLTGSGYTVTEDITEDLSGTNSWRYVWDTKDLGSGDYKITAQAWDPSDNYNYTYRTIRLTTPAPPKDLKPPVVTIDTPANGQQVPQDSVVEVSGTARDDIGIAMVSVSMDGGTTYQNAKLTGEHWSLVWNVPANEEPDDRVIVVEAKDTSGKSAEISSFISVVDTWAPFVIWLPELESLLESPQPGDSVSLSISAFDNYKLDRLEISYLNVENEPIRFPKGSDSVELDYDLLIPYDAPAGEMAVTVTVYDTSGNVDSLELPIDIAPLEEEEDEEDEKDKKEGISPMWIIFGIGLVALTIALFAFGFYMSKKK